MKTTFTLLFTLFYLTNASAQCYTGIDFSTAQFFDESWIYNCGTGTSCNAGTTTFNNQSPCDPTTAIDACAPTPSCGNVSDMASDLWFKFSANTATATISVIRNGSLGIGIQAFSAPNFLPTCSQLTEVGCIADYNTSGNTQLNLTSLTPGNLYFFRVYGIGNPASHRTGNFCFCGSTGLTSIALPIKLLSFSGSFIGKQIILQWTASQQQSGSYFEIEKSINGNSFITVGREPVIDANGTPVNYHFEENASATGTTLYRLKMVDIDGKFGYSDIVKLDNDNKHLSSGFTVKQDDHNHQIIIYSDTDTEAEVYSLTGSKLATYHLAKGNNFFYNEWKPGMYIIRKKDTGETQKFSFYR